MTKRIPTLIGLFGVIATLGVFSFAFNAMQPYISRATPSSPPNLVTFTNVADTSFTINWHTLQKSTGLITAKDTRNKTITSYDERDTSGQLGLYSSHSVTVRNISPLTTYTVTIVSDGKQFNDPAYSVTTGPTLSEDPLMLEPTYGTITLPDGTAAEGSIVSVTLDGSQQLSTLVTSSGAWVIPLNRIRTENLQAYIPVEDRMTETIVVQGELDIAKAITDTLNDNPVPSMVIGKEYDFRKIQVTAPSVAPQIARAVSITQPISDSFLPTDLPLFAGTGVASSAVSLVFGITKPQTGTTTVGNDGIWRFTPAKPLSPGKQSVTITTKDTNGKNVAMTTMFSILKSGTQVLGDATPSASLTLTPTLTSTPYASPSDDLVADPPPVSGVPLPFFLLLLIGIGLLLSGVVLIV